MDPSFVSHQLIKNSSYSGFLSNFSFFNIQDSLLIAIFQPICDQKFHRNDKDMFLSCFVPLRAEDRCFRWEFWQFNETGQGLSHRT